MGNCCTSREGEDVGAVSSTSAKGLHSAAGRSVGRAGCTAVHARYHRLPKRFSDVYEIDRKTVLGSGYAGSVYQATGKVQGHKFAVKSLKLHGLTEDQRTELEQEFEIFLSLDHPHVTRLIDVFEDETYLTLVMECMEGGELLKRIQEKKKFSEGTAATSVWQMLLAINYLHHQGIVHRDLKLENFLFEKEGTDHLKLLDFGFSKVTKKTEKMKLSCGTLLYVAPEVLKGDYDKSCDLWSFGVITFILLSGYMPFHAKTDNATMQLIQRGQYKMKEERWGDVSDDAKDFVKKLLVVDPALRLTAPQALEHSWIKNSSDRSGGDGASSESLVSSDVVDSLAEFASSTRFQRACMSVMAWSLTKEDRAKVRDAFVDLDTDNTGTISVAELRTVLQGKISEEEMGHIFEALDSSGDNEINYSEFLAAMLSTQLDVDDAMIEKTFDKMDKSHSGSITAQDLESLLGKDSAEAKELIAEADADGDGTISKAEFKSYMESSQKKKKSKRPKK